MFRSWTAARKLIFLCIRRGYGVLCCSGLFVEQDDAMQRVGSEPRDGRPGSRGDDVLGL